MNWRELALCRQHDPALFFPSKGDPGTEAKRVCRHCPVRPNCLDYAVQHRIEHGIWGGESERARRRLWLEDAA